MYQMLLQMHRLQEARLELNEAVKANPADPEPYVILGQIALQERRVPEAKSDFEKAKQLLGGYRNAQRKGAIEGETLSGMAQVAEAGGDWKQAAADLRDMLKIATQDLSAHQRLAHALFWQGEAEKAYAVLQEAKTIDRENAAKHGTREVFLVPEAVMGRYYDEFEGETSTTGNAEKWYRAALKKAPADLVTRQVVAIWAISKGKIAFAKEQADAALRIEASDADAYRGRRVGDVLRGLVGLWEKDWPAAELHFQKVLDQSPADIAARNNIALALVEQKDQAKKDRALGYAEANLRDDPNNAEMLSTMGWVRFRRNEFDEAAQALELSVKATDQATKAAGKNTDLDTPTYRAYVLDRQGKKWQAKEILESVLKTDRPFSMKPEAQELYEKVKNAKRPEAAAEIDGPANQ